jgi:hypothetical protein
MGSGRRKVSGLMEVAGEIKQYDGEQVGKLEVEGDA